MLTAQNITMNGPVKSNPPRPVMAGTRPKQTPIPVQIHPQNPPMVVMVKEPGGLNRKIGCADIFVYGLALIIALVVGGCGFIFIAAGGGK